MFLLTPFFKSEEPNRFTVLPCVGSGLSIVSSSLFLFNLSKIANFLFYYSHQTGEI